MRKMEIYYIIVILLSVSRGQILNLPEGSPCEFEEKTGICHKSTLCKTFLADGLDRNYPPICSKDEKGVYICCTACEKTEDIRNAVVTKAGDIAYRTGEKIHDKCLEIARDTPQECMTEGYAEKQWDDSRQCFDLLWHKSRFLYPSNQYVDRRDFYNLAILGNGDVSAKQYLCGGSIISNKYVLTAASCFFKPEGSVTYVRAGMLSMYDDMKLEHYAVKRTVPHPDFKTTSKYHDIGLVETELPIQFMRSTACPACLFRADLMAENATFDVAGWNGTTYEQVYNVTLDEASPNECMVRFPAQDILENGFNETTQLCYKSRRDQGDKCDSVELGTPLQVLSKYCNPIVVGVTSFPRPCSQAGGVGVFTRVEPYADWIASVVWP